MIEPTLALQTAIRAALVASPAVTDLVPADHIHARSTRPDRLPAILLGSGAAEVQGALYTANIVAKVVLDVHVWALNDGLIQAQAIGGVVMDVLRYAPASTSPDFDIEYFRHVRTFWPRDPEPNYGHGVLTVEAVVRVRP